MSVRKQYETLIGIAIMLLIIPHLMKGSESTIYVSSGTAIVLILIAFFIPGLRLFLAKVWEQFGLIISKISSTIILSIVYFLLLTPLAFFYRLFRSKSKTSSFFVEREHRFTAADLKNQF